MGSGLWCATKREMSKEISYEIKTWQSWLAALPLLSAFSGMEILLAIARLLGLGGGQRAQQTVGFIVGTGSEKQGVGLPVVGGTHSAKADSPQAVDGEGLLGDVIDHHAFVVSGEQIEAVDHAIAEVADQQPMREFAEVARRKCRAPGCVEPVSVLQAAQQPPSGIVHTNKTEPRTVVFIVAPRCPMSKRHDQVSTDVLNVEGGPVHVETGKAESVIILRMQPVKAAVEDFDPARLKVGSVKSSTAIYLGNRAAFVNGLASAVLENHRVGIHGGIPAGDGAILSHEQEERLRSGPDQKSGRGVENRSRGSRRAGTIGRGNGHDQGLWRTGRVVQSG